MPFAFLRFHHIPLDRGGRLVCLLLRFLCVKIAEKGVMQMLMLIWGAGRERERSLEQTSAKLALGGAEGCDAGVVKSSPLPERFTRPQPSLAFSVAVACNGLP